MRDANSFSATSAGKLKLRFCKKITNDSRAHGCGASMPASPHDLDDEPVSSVIFIFFLSML